MVVLRPAVELAPTPVGHGPVQREAKGNWFLLLLRTTDHKIIARVYLVTALGFFLAAGVMAVLMRARSCCCCSRRPWCSRSPTSCCRCTSARRTWRSRG